MNYTVYPRTSDAVKFNKMYRQSAIYRIRSIYQAAIETANSKQPLWVGSQFRKVKGVDDLIIYVLPCTEAGTGRPHTSGVSSYVPVTHVKKLMSWRSLTTM